MVNILNSDNVIRLNGCSNVLEYQILLLFHIKFVLGYGTIIKKYGLNYTLTIINSANEKFLTIV